MMIIIEDSDWNWINYNIFIKYKIYTRIYKLKEEKLD